MDLNPQPGSKSSEFKAIVVYAVVLLANGTEYVNIDQDQMLAFAGVIAGYAGLRSLVKTNSVKAVVAAALNGKK